jgi:uncharacterized protein (DUF697 family)
MKKLPRVIWPAATDSNAAAALGATERDAMIPVLPDRDSAAVAAAAVIPPEHEEPAAIEAKRAKLPAVAASGRDDRRPRAMKLVRRYALWSGVAGLVPVPFVDVAAVGGVQIQMLRRVSQIYAVPFSENVGKALIAGLVGSTIPASTGIGAASMIKGAPIVGTAVGLTVMPAMSVGATYAIGVAFIQHFATGGTLLDFNPPDYREFIKARANARRRRNIAH